MKCPKNNMNDIALTYETKIDEALPEISQKPGVTSSFGISSDASGSFLPTRSFQSSIGKSGVNVNLGSQLQSGLNTVNIQGGGAVHLRAGTYAVKATLNGFSETEIAGDAAGTTIMDFGAANIGLAFTGTSAYTTGTISAISANGITVTGSGTSWLANVTTSHQLFIGTRWYKIAAITGNTTIILSEAYSDNLTLPQNYRALIPIQDLIFRDLTFQNSTGTLITFNDCRDISFINCRFLTSVVGLSFTNCSEMQTNNLIVAGNSSDGVQMTNVGLCDFTSLETIGNGGNGVTLSNLKTAFFLACASDANAGSGISGTTVVDCAFKYECRSNGGKGIELVSGCTNNFINDSLVRSNASDGIKFTASDSNNTIGGSISVTNNGGYGINLAAASDANNIILAPNYSSLGGVAIAYDATASGSAPAASTSLTYAHTCTGSNLILIVTTVCGAATQSVTGITYAGAAMTKVAGSEKSQAQNGTIALWYLVNPSSGANNVIVSFTSDVLSSASTSYTGARQVNQPDNSTNNSAGAGGSITTTLATVSDNCWTVLGASSNQLTAIGAGAGTTSRSSITGSGTALSLGILDSNGPKTPAGNSSLIATGTAGFWVTGMISLVPSTISNISGDLNNAGTNTKIV